MIIMPSVSIKPRSPDQTAISISMDNDLRAQIDDRAKSLGLNRSKYLALLARNDIASGGDMTVREQSTPPPNTGTNSSKKARAGGDLLAGAALRNCRGKNLLTAALLLLALPAFAQEKSSIPPTMATNAPVYRKVGDKVYNLTFSTNWFELRGEVFAINDGVILLHLNWKYPTAVQWQSHSYGRYDGVKAIAITNYPTTNVAAGQVITAKAIRTGLFNYYKDAPSELWDCGTPFQPAPPKPVIKPARTNAPGSEI